MSDTALIVGDRPGWHSQQLQQAFQHRGIAASFLALDRIEIDFRCPYGIRLGADQPLPRWVFVRSIPGGDLSQIVRRLTVLHALSDSGCIVYNKASAIEDSVDKGLTSWRLRQAGLPTPDTLITTAAERVKDFVKTAAVQKKKVVYKPLFGAQGEGVRHITETDLQQPNFGFETLPTVFYLQHFISSAGIGGEFRLLIVGSQIFAMERRSKNWIRNISCGGTPVPTTITHEQRMIAQQACQILALNHAGVDILHDLQGRCWLLEVNGIPAWQGLQSVCQIDLAQKLVDDLLMQPARAPFKLCTHVLG